MNKFYFLFLVSFSLSAQIKGVVKDSISGQPIPYVNIWVENETIGTTSEENGSFSLDIKEEKALVFSALGYESKKSSSKHGIILLKPKVFELNEVVIEQLKFQKEIEVGNFSKTEGYHISGDLEWSNAKFFKYETTYEQTKFVKKIKITTRSKVNNAKFKIRLYSVNKEGYPENDLLNEDIIVTVKKGKKNNVIDISMFKLVFPEEGLFVAYEVLKIESNKYEFKYTENNGKKLIKKSYYAPDFECNLVDEQNTYHFRNGKWNQHQRWHNSEIGSLKHINNKVFEPSINLILTN
ncbi:carboxypeptidase-like regulatory domain-containing protein [Flavobacterium ammonificans]|jgi:hypothetical protein|uniref:carboxypeptidase-like regulatory domain-containing protein n=1 Tax=Flavobacterium ammonificans TaxID=1751056 RepID=UPI001E28FEB8|nr:carboxypeptidase-like regulatory domain-containing protein [Flavobacterium ammonificans]BDB56270.1 membrane protein [Flavobacterium ammonificans]